MTADKKGKLAFAPLPVRAIGDTSLSPLAVRVLAAIAYHDRLSAARGAGQGCWAGNNKLAQTCKCHLASLSTAITELVSKGYITREPHPINKRLRVYRVIYEDTNHSPFGERSSQDDLSNGERSSDDSLPTDKPFDDNTNATISQMANDDPTIVCRHKSQVADFNEKSGVEYIPHKREDITLKREDNSSEEAPIKIGAGRRSDEYRSNVGAYLARLERSLRANGETLDDDERDYIEALADSFDRTDPLHNQALRIIDLWSDPS